MRKVLTSGAWTWVTLALALVCILSSGNVFQLVTKGEAEAMESLRAIELLNQLDRSIATMGDPRRPVTPAMRGALGHQIRNFRTLALERRATTPAFAGLAAKMAALEAALAKGPAEETQRAALVAAQGVQDVLQLQWHRQARIRQDMATAWRSIQVLVILSGLLAAFPAILLRLYHRDLTDGRKSEAALRESEERLRRLVDVSPEAILVHRDGKLTFINEAGLTLLGAVSPQAVIGQPILSFVHPDDHASVWQNWDNIRLTGQSGTRAGQRMIRLDKTVVHVEVIATPFADHDTPAVQLIVRDVTEHRRREEASQKAHSRMQDLVAHLMEGVFRLSEDGRFLEANPALITMLGYDSFAELQLANFNTLYADLVQRDQHKAILARDQELRQAECRLLRRDGAFLSAVLNCRRVPDASGVAWIEGTLSDVTEAQEREARLAAYAVELETLQGRLDERAEEMRAQAQSLAEARDAALEASRLKSQFLASVSHEIRTPMNGVTGMLTLLAGTNLTPEQSEYTESARRSAEFLLGLLNDILDFSRLGAGKLSLEPADFSVRSAVHDVLDLVTEAALAKNLELACLIHPTVPAHVRGAALRVRQILTNLVANAVKYTDQGEVRLTVAPAPGLPGRLRFEVRDTGPGLRTEDRRHLFEPLVQGSGDPVRHGGGTGLGLAISRQLVESMNGEIGVDSELGRGSCFWFVLPFEPAQSTPADQSLRLASQERFLEGKRVLFAVMNPVRRKIRRAQLMNWSVVAVEARGGMELFALLRAAVAQNEPFDAVLVEAELPDTNSFRLAEEIAADPALEGTRVILLSPFGRRSLSELGASLHKGFAALLPQPVRSQDLLDTLATTSGWVPDFPPDDPNPSRDLPAEPTGARILLAEDNAVNQRVARKLLVRLGYEVDLAASGREALAALAERPYAMVLMDCQMPDLDGFEATREIRRREGADRHVPVIAMTAYAMQGDRERCLAAGMDDYLSKPVALDQLREAVERWVHQRTPLPANFTS